MTDTLDNSHESLIARDYCAQFIEAGVEIRTREDLEFILSDFIFWWWSCVEDVEDEDEGH